jgi:DNA-binding winged helix-turn-helix (wHTH) protein
MGDMSLLVYGYSIGDTLVYRISDPIILNLKRKDSGDYRGRFAYVKLRETMSLLLLYLLENAGKGIIKDDELITFVWEQRGLKGSYHRLWQVMTSLKKKMQDIGFEQDFIYRVNSNGYMVREGIVSPIYRHWSGSNDC